jgi:hypothetical protein
MRQITAEQENVNASTLTGDTAQASLRFVWQIIRLPVVFLLLVLEPAVDIVFGVVAFLGILMAIFFNVYGIPIEFPFYKMLAVSVCFALAPCAYGGLLRLLAK